MVRGKHAKPSETAKKVKKTSTAIAATFATGVMVATGTELASTAVASEQQDSHVRFVDSQQESVTQQQSAGVPDVDSTLNPPAPSSTQEAQQAPVTSLQREDASKGQVAQANQNLYEENPTVPLPNQIAASIPDDADVVGPDYAISADNSTVWRLDTGEQVTDPALVGTPDHPADPLALSNGHRFLRVPVSRVREEMAQAGRSSQARVQTQVQHNQDCNSTAKAGQGDQAAQAGQANPAQQAENSSAASPQGSVNTSATHEADQSSSDGAVHGTFARAHIPGETLATSAGKYAGSTQATTFQGNEYGAHWGSDTGGAAFKDYQGRTMVYQARLFADISQWQGYPDWNQVKNSGIQGVIIRIGYGTDGIDTSAQYNIQQAKKHGIPFGVYLFSYAENGKEAYDEGMHTVNLLRRYGVSPSDLALPVYYDLEWYRLPSSTYDSIANNWWSALQANGYKNLALYASTSWYNTYLNTPNLHAKAGWVAQYGALLQYRNFTSPSKFFGWQYSSKGRVAGIAGNVDLNAFGYTEPVSNPWLGQQGNIAAAAIDITKRRLITIPDGNYYISSHADISKALDVTGQSSKPGTKLEIYNANHSPAQQFRFTRQNDGSYIISNVASGQPLDVDANRLSAGKALQQWPSTGATGQRWFLRDAGKGGVFLQSALGNMVIDLDRGAVNNGNKIQLWYPNGEFPQIWHLSSADVTIPDGTVKIGTAASPNQVLETPAARSDTSLQMQLWSWNNNAGQVWRFTALGNGVYTVTNLVSGKLLDARGGSAEPGTVVQQYPANGSSAQRWVVRDGGNGTVMLQNLNSGLFLDVPQGNTRNGTQMWLWNGNNLDPQKFRINSVDSSLVSILSTRRSQINDFAAAHRNDLPDGTYRFAVNANNALFLSVHGNKSDDLANVELAHSNGLPMQEWNVRHDAQGYVTLTNVGSGKILDLNQGLNAGGTNVQIYHSNNELPQKWIAVKQGDAYVFRSAVDTRYAVDITGGVYSEGTNVEIWETTNSLAQQWRALPPLLATEKADAMAKAFSGTIQVGAHRFASAVGNGQMLDLSKGSAATGANIQVWTANGASPQLWLISQDAQGYVTFTNAASGKVLDVANGDARNGTNIRQWTANGSRAQKWIAVAEDGGVVFHSAIDPSYVLDVNGGSSTPGTNVQLWIENGGSAQRWIG